MLSHIQSTPSCTISPPYRTPSYIELFALQEVGLCPRVVLQSNNAVKFHPTPYRLFKLQPCIALILTPISVIVCTAGVHSKTAQCYLILRLRRTILLTLLIVHRSFHIAPRPGRSPLSGILPLGHPWIQELNVPRVAIHSGSGLGKDGVR